MAFHSTNSSRPTTALPGEPCCSSSIAGPSPNRRGPARHVPGPRGDGGAQHPAEPGQRMAVAEWLEAARTDWLIGSRPEREALVPEGDRGGSTPVPCAGEFGGGRRQVRPTRFLILPRVACSAAPGALWCERGRLTTGGPDARPTGLPRTLPTLVAAHCPCRRRRDRARRRAVRDTTPRCYQCP